MIDIVIKVNDKEVLDHLAKDKVKLDEEEE